MKIIALKNAEEISEAVSEIVIEQVKKKPNSILGLATGSSPLLTYKKIISKSLKDKISFKDVKTFNLDEYLGISENDVHSYKFFMNENLFKFLDFKNENHFFPSADNFDKYDLLIEREGGIDLQLLGIGANGHIAFNEPYTDLKSLTHITELDNQTINDNARFFSSLKDVPQKAVTMGLQSILNTKKIVLIATGRNKAEAIRKVLKGVYDPSCPASALNLMEREVLIFVDDELNKSL